MKKKNKLQSTTFVILVEYQFKKEPLSLWFLSVDCGIDTAATVKTKNSLRFTPLSDGNDQ
jgi:hypothetical protein